MMNDEEREAGRLGMQILDQALVSLGQKPALANPDFRVTEPVVGDIPTTVLEKPGAAPFRFVFGRDLDVWVGPFSEVILAPVRTATEKETQQRIELLLQSSVTCRPGKRSIEIAFQRPGRVPWLRLKVRAAGVVAKLEATYSPYVD